MVAIDTRKQVNVRVHIQYLIIVLIKDDFINKECKETHILCIQMITLCVA